MKGAQNSWSYLIFLLGFEFSGEQYFGVTPRHCCKAGQAEIGSLAKAKETKKMIEITKHFLNIYGRISKESKGKITTFSKPFHESLGPTIEIVILVKSKYLAIIALICSAVTASISRTYSR